MINIEEMIKRRAPFADMIKKIIHEYKQDFMQDAPRGYGPIIEGLKVARYQPWTANRYAEIYKTALSYDRLYMIEQFVNKQIRELGAGAFVEFGIFEGGVTRMMLDMTESTDCEVVAFDSFEGVQVSGAEDRHKDGDYACNNADAVKAYIDGAIIFEGKIPEVLKEEAPNEFFLKMPIAFAHIDLDVYLPTKAALEFTLSNIGWGAVIIVDDYGLESCPGVKQAVDEFVEEQDVTSIYLPTGQVVIMP